VSGLKIAQVLAADSWGGVNAQSLQKGIGGREGAMIRLAREWARAGHEVTNFVATKTPERIYEGDGFFEFVPAEMGMTMLATFPYAACIGWESPRCFVHPRVQEMQKVRLVEMQCAHLVMEDIPAVAEFATGVCGLSQWHVDFLAHQGVEGPFYVLPNGVDLEKYPKRRRKTPGADPKFFYSSSPDRGLWNLLQTWPYIRRYWPGAELTVAYGLKRFLMEQMWSHRRQGQMAVEMAAMIQQEGIYDVGQVGQDVLAEIQMASDIMAYPCDTIAPTETGCITVIEAMAAGCPVAITDADCLEEEFGHVADITPLPFRPLEYVSHIGGILENKGRYQQMSRDGRAFAETRQWKDIAPRWLELFEEQAAL
jgi:glycosyltransferase involved in cell wall biosynthesis